MKKAFLTGIICSVTGFLLGYAFRDTPAQRPEDTPLAVQSLSLEAVTRERESAAGPYPNALSRQDKAEALVSTLQARVAQLAEQNRVLQSSLSAASTPPRADATTIAIPKRLVLRLNLEAIGKDYSLGEDIIDVLEITDAEKRRIENSLLDARAQLDEMELKRSVVESQTDTSVTLSIAPFEQEGTAVRNTLIGDIRAVLGDERAEVFVEFFDRAATQQRFNRFGQAKQDVTVTVEGSGRLRVDSRFSIVTPTSSSVGSQSQFYGKEEIPENFRHLFEIQQ